MISPRFGHENEVICLDVAILASILEERVLNVGYIILQHMLSTQKIPKRSLPFSTIITHILKHFRVPLIKPNPLGTKELGDKVIANLEFIWMEDQWVKYPRYKSKFTNIALADDHIFNDILSLEELPDFSNPRRYQPPPSEGPSHSSLTAPSDLMQQLLTEVRSISEQQSQLQSQFEAFQIQSISEKQRLFNQQQRLFAQQHSSLLNNSNFSLPLDFHHYPLHHIRHL